MAELTVYASTASGRIEAAGSTYLTMRAGAGLAAYTNPQYVYTGQLLDGGDFFLNALYLEFDTSEIAAGDTITGVAFAPYLWTGYGNNTPHVAEVYAYDWGAGVTTADWVAGDDIGDLGDLLASFDTTGLPLNESQAGWKTFTNEDAMLSAIVKGGTTRFLVICDRFRLGTEPSGPERVGWYLNQEDCRPRLIVTYTEGATPVSQTLQDTYSVATLVSQTLQDTYSVATLVSQTLQDTYSVATLVSQALKDTYDLAGYVSQTLQDTYNVSALVSQTLQDTYNVSALVSQTYQDTYGIGGPIGQTVTDTYDILALVSQTLKDTYNVLVCVSQTLQDAYHVVNAGTISIERRTGAEGEWEEVHAGVWEDGDWTDTGPFVAGTTYYYRAQATIGGQTSGYSNVEEVNYLASGIVINAASTLTNHDLSLEVASTLSDTYNVATLVSQTLQDTYDVKASISQTYQDTYDLAALIAQTYRDTYNMGGLVAQTFTDTYGVGAYVSQTLKDTYNVLTLVSQTLQDTYNMEHSYDLYVPVSQTYQDTYGILTLISQTYQDTYNMGGFVAQTLQDTYNITAPSTGMAAMARISTATMKVNIATMKER
jgi:hypothetical protein